MEFFELGDAIAIKKGEQKSWLYYCVLHEYEQTAGLIPGRKTLLTKNTRDTWNNLMLRYEPVTLEIPTAEYTATATNDLYKLLTNRATFANALTQSNFDVQSRASLREVATQTNHTLVQVRYLRWQLYAVYFDENDFEAGYDPYNLPGLWGRVLVKQKQPDWFLRYKDPYPPVVGL
jgi:hypothetical protein